MDKLLERYGTKFSVTNKNNEDFISGWQTRWFVLEDGVLAYYKSQEEIKLGCKGSMKVLACEINGIFFFFAGFFQGIYFVCVFSESGGYNANGSGNTW